MEGGDRAAGSDGNTADNNEDQLMRTTLAVLNNFTSNYVRQHGGDTIVLLGVEESTDPDIQKVVERLRKLEAELDAGRDFQSFTSNYVRQHGGDTSVLLGVEESTDPDIKKKVENVRKIGDKVDPEFAYQRFMQDFLPMTRENFMEVAKEVFSDNKYNWGRVVTLFILACRLVMKAIEDKIPDTVKDIMAWTLEFIKKHVLNWIERQGGWEASLSNVNDKPGWKKFLFLGGLTLIVVFVIVRKCRGTSISLDK